MADQSDRNCVVPARQGMTRKPYKSLDISLRGRRARWFPDCREAGNYQFSSQDQPSHRTPVAWFSEWGSCCADAVNNAQCGNLFRRREISSRTETPFGAGTGRHRRTSAVLTAIATLGERPRPARSSQQGELVVIAEAATTS